MGVLIKRASDRDLYTDTLSEVERLLRISEPTHLDRENLVLEQSVARPAAPVDYEKLTTAKFAAKLGVDSNTFYELLIRRGYLELRDGDKRYLTPKGKSAGGEFRTVGKGPFFLWPLDLEI